MQPIHVSRVRSSNIKKNNVDFVLMGKQSIDDDFNQTGQMTASMLNWAQATFASKIDYLTDESKFVVEREIDVGTQKVKVPKNCVITCDLRLNKPRLPKLPDIMKAKKKTIENIDITDFDLSDLLSLTTVSVEEPVKRKSGVVLASVDELIDKLRNEAKVI
mgnify:FL=1